MTDAGWAWIGPSGDPAIAYLRARIAWEWSHGCACGPGCAHVAAERIANPIGPPQLALGDGR